MRFKAILLIFIISTLYTCKQEKFFVALEGGAYLREEANDKSKILVTIPGKEEVQILQKDGPEHIFLGKEGNWFKVQYKKIEGWVFGPLLRSSNEINKLILVVEENKLMEVPISTDRYSNFKIDGVLNNNQTETVLMDIFGVLGNACTSFYKHTSCKFALSSPVTVEIFPEFTSSEDSTKSERRGLYDIVPSEFRLFKAILFALAREKHKSAIEQSNKNENVDVKPQIPIVAHEAALFKTYDYQYINQIWQSQFGQMLVTVNDSMPMYNSSAIVSAFEKYYLKPKDNFKGNLMKVIYDKVIKKGFRYYAKKINQINTSTMNFDIIVQKYHQEVVSDTMFINRFIDEIISKLPGYRFAEEVFVGERAKDKETNPFFWGYDMVSFVIRRKYDGSFDTIWKIMGQIAQDYDPYIFQKYWATSKK